MKYFYIVLTFVIAMFLAVVIYSYVSKTDNSGNQNQIGEISGTVSNVSASVRIINLITNSGQSSLALTSETKIFDKQNKEVDLSYVQRGYQLNAKGKFSDSGSFIPDLINITLEPNIIVFTPKADDQISRVVHITGIARVFENQLNARVSANGVKITEVSIYANSPDMGFYGDFEKDIILSSAQVNGISSLVLEVFEYSAKDGSEINKTTLPLLIFPSGVSQTTSVKAYFSNSNLDPEISCNKVFPVERQIPKTQAVARGALDELLGGPSASEKSQGYFTSINEGVGINSLTITSGTAKIDFDERLESGVGGSCRVSAIRSQITQTLKQFTTVNDVIISINGRTEDILQP